jgi:hypothetical protein
MTDKSGNPATTDKSIIDALDQPLNSQIASLRTMFLSADPAISEEIKWNAPSFRTSEHFATMHLRARNAVQLILHLGAKPKRTVPPGAIADPEGLLKWLGADRASVGFTGATDLAHKSDALVAIIRQWIKHV